MTYFKIRPTELADKLRYTESQPLRDWCAAMDSAMAPYFAEAMELTRKLYADGLLYGNAYVEDELSPLPSASKAGGDLPVNGRLDD